jgi:hypothetical protein
MLRSTSGWAITALTQSSAKASLTIARRRRSRALARGALGDLVADSTAPSLGAPLKPPQPTRSGGSPPPLPGPAPPRRRTWPSRARRRGRALTSARSPHDGRVQEVHAPGVSEPNMPPDLSGARLPKAPAPSDCRRPPIGRRCGEPSRVLIASPEGGRATVGSHQQRAWADEAECPSGERVEAAEAAPAPIRPPHLRPATCRRRAAQSGVRRASRADVKTGAFPFSAGAPAPRTGQDRGTRTDRAHASKGWFTATSSVVKFEHRSAATAEHQAKARSAARLPISAWLRRSEPSPRPFRYRSRSDVPLRLRRSVGFSGGVAVATVVFVIAQS